MEMRLVVVTRIHAVNSSKLPSLEKINRFIECVEDYADELIIILGASSLNQLQSYSEEVEKLVGHIKPNFPVHIHPVYPWGYFTSALNQAITLAQDRKSELIAFQSFEFTIEKSTVQQMVKIMKSRNALVVGPVLEGHDFHPGWNDIRGRTTPWNTFAIWQTKKLAVIGFPLIGDGTADNRRIGGVEEVSAITLAQNHLKEESIAILTQTTSSTWNTDFSDDPKRAEYHAEKMRSKDERPSEQLSHLRFEQSGRVYHMTLDEFQQF